MGDKFSFMEEWNRDILINLLDSLIDYRGKTPKKTSSGVPLVTAKIIKGGRILPFEEFIAEDNYDSWMVRGLPQPGDVVLTTEAPLGEVAQLDNTKVALAQRVVTLRGKKGILDNTYLKYFLQSDIGQKRLIARETGTTVTGIKQSELRKVEISYPDFDTQCRIASILKSLDDKIALNNRINHNLEEQAQALYRSWFVDFKPFKSGKFVDSELGFIPDGWHVGTLSELVEVRYGKDHKMLNDGRIPVYGSGGLMRYADRSLFESESVLIPRKGTLNNVMYVNHPFWTVDTMFYTIGKTEHVIKYAHLFLLTQDLASMNAGSAVPSMTTDILNKLPILIPTLEVLNTFDTVVSSVYSIIRSDQVENASLASIRDSILPQLMSGVIDINSLN